MPWPPVVPPTTVTDATAQLGVHATYHNQLAQALNDTVTKIGSLPLGRVASAQITSGAPTAGTTIADLVSVAFTAVAGRRYRLSACATYASGAAQALYFILTDGANTQVQSVAVQVAAAGQPLSATPWVEIPPGAAGARTYKLRIVTTTGTASPNVTATQPAQILVEDVGT